jgi:hypothetical protein
MSCRQGCNCQLLHATPTPLRGLITLDARRDQIKTSITLQLNDRPEKAGQVRDPDDAWTEYVERLVKSGALPLFVMACNGNYAHQICQSVLTDQCRCLSLRDSIKECRFITKPALLTNASLEAEQDGRPLLVRKIDATDAFKMRPPSEAALENVVRRLIEQAIKQGDILTNSEICLRVCAEPGMHLAPHRTILRIAQSLKPRIWSQSGRRPSRNA